MRSFRRCSRRPDAQVHRPGHRRRAVRIEHRRAERLRHAADGQREREALRDLLPRLRLLGQHRLRQVDLRRRRHERLRLRRHDRHGQRRDGDRVDLPRVSDLDHRGERERRLGHRPQPAPLRAARRRVVGLDVHPARAAQRGDAAPVRRDGRAAVRLDQRPERQALPAVLGGQDPERRLPVRAAAICRPHPRIRRFSCSPRSGRTARSRFWSSTGACSPTRPRRASARPRP